MKVKIKIHTAGGGCDSVWTVDGELTASGGAIILNYLWEGDNCRTEIESGKLIQNRRGQVNLDLYYFAGRKTVCKIYYSGGAGEYEVFTNKLAFERSGEIYTVALTYESGGEITEINMEIVPA